MRQPGIGQPSIVVVGGGIIGAFAAYSLARAGADVTLVERTELGGQASQRNPGGLNPLHGPGIPGPMQKLALQSLQLQAEVWEDVRRLSGIDFSPSFIARIYVALDESEATTLAMRESLYNATTGFSARLLDSSELRRLEPRITSDALCGLWCEGNARVSPQSYARAVAEAARAVGARVLHAEARELRYREGRASAVVLDQVELPCDAVVIATGTLTEGPERWLNTALRVSPLKGELLLVEVERPLAADVTCGLIGAYTTAQGQLWLGGTEVDAGFDAEPSPAGREQILAGMRELLPGLGTVKIVRHVAGLRPVTPDGLPLVGVPTGWENVCVAVGAGRKGMLLGAAMGLAAAELLTKGETTMAIGGCALSRLEVTV